MSNEKLAVRASLRLLWQALQPYHFWIGFHVGSLAVLAMIVMGNLIQGASR